jgi:hypothetical protein
MNHRFTVILAVAAASILGGATAAHADRDLSALSIDSATGDWSCQLGESAIGTLSVRSASYVFGRPGAAMGGEYSQAGNELTVISGPLRGLGIAGGALVADVAARTLRFPTDSGAILSCREVL